MKIKVCGLTKVEQIHKLINLKIDFFGFIFYKKSPRYVLDHLSLAEIKFINSNKKIGVFVNEDLEKVIEISRSADLNYIQLHGYENLEYVSQLKEHLGAEIKIIKVISVGIQELEALQERLELYKNEADYYLFDTDSKAFGGTGKSFSWQVLNELKIYKPYFLSGGISSDNIEEIKNIKKKPFALDINSKFEIEAGSKDVGKIKVFKNNLELNKIVS